MNWPSAPTTGFFFFFFFFRDSKERIIVGMVLRPAAADDEVDDDEEEEAAATAAAADSVNAFSANSSRFRFFPAVFRASKRARFSASCFLVAVHIDVELSQPTQVYTISDDGAISLVVMCFFLAIRRARLYARDDKPRLW
jgi:hypothetical protein